MTCKIRQKKDKRHSPILDFISSSVSRKHRLKKDPSLFPENEVSHWPVYNKVNVILLSRNETLLKWLVLRNFTDQKFTSKQHKNCQTIT